MQQLLRGCAAAVAIFALAAAPVRAGDADATSEMALLLGAWDCSGLASGAAAVEVYRRVDETTMAITGSLSAARGTDRRDDETLRYDRGAGVWSLAAGSGASFAERLSAPAWSAHDWTFTGTETVRGRSRAVRDVYSYVPPDAFVREHQIRSGERWQADAGYVCRRAPLEARYDAGTGSPPDDDDLAASPASREVHALGVVAAPAAVADRAYSLAHGIWDCSTFGGARATHTYTREGAETIKLHNVLSIGRHDYAIDELYRFDAAKELWTTTTEGRAYVGSAKRWLSDDWVFNGDMPLGGRRVAVQMIYSKVSEREFRRDFTREENGARATFAAETCRLR